MSICVNTLHVFFFEVKNGLDQLKYLLTGYDNDLNPFRNGFIVHMDVRARSLPLSHFSSPLSAYTRAQYGNYINRMVKECSFIHLRAYHLFRAHRPSATINDNAIHIQQSHRCIFVVGFK